MSVDLPAPFWPTIECTSPAATESVPSISAGTPPKDLAIPVISRRGAVILEPFEGGRRRVSRLPRSHADGRGQ
jgi:hypothetical protein